MRALSLFSGIGALDLGLEIAGFETAAFSEVDPYACRVLKRHWPDVPNLGDITKVEWHDTPHGLGAYVEGVGTLYLGDIDLISGGFPCQDISSAGRGKGIVKGETRSGLFHEVIRAVRDIRPRYVLLENVRNLLSSSQRRDFGTVLGEVAGLGYDAWWDVVSAAALGAPHLRERVCIVATRPDVAPFDTGRSPSVWAAAIGADAERPELQ